MWPPQFLIVLFLLLLSGCSTTPVPVPYTPPPAPAKLTAKCAIPDPLQEGTTDAKALHAKLAEWILFGGCEFNKRLGLIEAWPK